MASKKELKYRIDMLETKLYELQQRINVVRLVTKEPSAEARTFHEGKKTVRIDFLGHIDPVWEEEDNQ